MKLLLVAALSFAAVAQPPGPDLMANMQAIAQALGVSCEYCHSAPRGSGEPEPKKDIARAMIAMTRDVNTRIQTATGKAAAAATQVECVTCHRGVAIPAQLSDILMRTVREKGAPAAVEQYRELRKQYYGRQSYDFGENTLLDLGQRITAGRPDDAIALLKTNVEFYPRSVRSYAALAYAYTRKLDDATAISILEKALEAGKRSGARPTGAVEELPPKTVSTDSQDDPQRRFRPGTRFLACRYSFRLHFPPTMMRTFAVPARKGEPDGPSFDKQEDRNARTSINNVSLGGHCGRCSSSRAGFRPGTSATDEPVL